MEDIGKSKAAVYLGRAHCHTTWELCYNVDGSGMTTIGEETYPFKPGTVILYTAYYENRPGTVCDALFEAIMGLVRPALDSPRQNKYVQKLRQTIIAEFSNPDFKLQQIVEEIPINRDHLRRLFKDALGQTPHDYLLQLRIECAKRLLSRGGEEGAAVAEVPINRDSTILSVFSVFSANTPVFHQVSGSNCEYTQYTAKMCALCG